LDVKLARALVDAIGMRTRLLAVILALAALIVAAPAAAADDWLGEINRYRTAAGEQPVAADPSLDAGMDAHLVYLENDLQPGESPHMEVQGRPDYSDGGAFEAGQSNIAESIPGFSSGTAAIDSWWTSPFHAIGMLRPALAGTELALAPDGEWAMLDVFSDLTSFAEPTAPVLFPGPGIATNLTSYSGSEVPDPTTVCGSGHSGRYGLPLIALLPAAPATGLSATLAGPSGTQSLCVVDQNTFTSDPTGQEILEQDNAVVLIPSAPLAKGAYTANITQPGQSAITWSFTEGIVPAAAPAPSPTPAPTGTTAAPALPTGTTGTTGTTGKTGSAGSAGSTGSAGTTGKSGSTPGTAGTTHSVITLAAFRGSLALHGHGTATVTATATRDGRRLAQRTFHERGAHWRAALRLPRGLHGRRVTVTLRIVRDGRTTVLHRRLAL
jgi:Cysteine-rich secretory protein family